MKNHLVRYPVGYYYRHKCLFSFDIKQIEDKDCKELEKLDYIESRKRTYLPLYINSVKKHPYFLELQDKLKRKENLLIIEVDGPHQESLEYYKRKYNVHDSFIENHSMLCTKENMKIMLNDSKHPYGHCYCWLF